MSMIGNYCKITKAQFDLLIQNKISVSEFLYSDENSYVAEEDFLDIDKTWDCIHFVLTGTSMMSMAEDGNEILANENNSTRFNVVFGGKELGDEDVGYGTARYLTNEEVKAVYEEIKNITEDDFRNDFDIENMLHYGVYPLMENEDEDELFVYVYEPFRALQEFFRQASAEDKYMLLYIN